MWQIAGVQLALGVSVIVVSPLTYPNGYATACELTARHGARLLVIETVLEEAEWRRRLEARSPTESTHKLRGWETMQEQLRRYAGCWQYPIAPEHHLQVETSQPVEENLDLILARLV